MLCAIKKRSDKSLMFFAFLASRVEEKEEKKKKLTAREIHSS
jgi:hypothetical protein